MKSPTRRIRCWDSAEERADLVWLRRLGRVPPGLLRDGRPLTMSACIQYEARDGCMMSLAIRDEEKSYGGDSSNEIPSSNFITCRNS